MIKVYKYTFLVFAFLFLSTNIEAIEKERIVKKSYKVDSDTELKIKNSFGKVEVESYDGNEIFIEVRIWAKGSSEKKVEKFINSIEIDFDESSDEIEVETSSTSNNGKVKKFEVNYKVKMPIGNELTINNSFGNVYIGNHTGKVELDISHGNFEVGNIENPNNEIELQFGNGNIKKFSSGSIDMQHSNLDVGSVVELKLDSEFSNVKVTTVRKSIDAEVSHGSLIVRELKDNFTDVEIDIEFSKLKLSSENVAYDLEYYGSFSSINKPNNIEVNEKDTDINSEKIKGKVNGGGNRVVIKASFSDIKLD